MAACTKKVHYFASDEASASDYHDFHIFVFGFRCFVLQNDIILAL